LLFPPRELFYTVTDAIVVAAYNAQLSAE
jgi:hypothetical protein